MAWRLLGGMVATGALGYVDTGIHSGRVIGVHGITLVQLEGMRSSAALTVRKVE